MTSTMASKLLAKKQCHHLNNRLSEGRKSRGCVADGVNAAGGEGIRVILSRGSIDGGAQLVGYLLMMPPRTYACVN